MPAPQQSVADHDNPVEGPAWYAKGHSGRKINRQRRLVPFAVAKARAAQGKPAEAPEVPLPPELDV